MMLRRSYTLAIVWAAGSLAACTDDTEVFDRPIIQFAPASAMDCPQGGQVVLTGIDLDQDGILSGPEIASQEIICAGEPGDRGLPGTNALILTTPEPMGMNCADGGLRIDVGADDDADGILQAAEIEATTFACDGADGLDGLTSLVRTSPDVGAACETTGLVIEYGLDANGDGVLQDTEVSESEILCTGEVGFESIVITTDEPAGANCPIGGERIDQGLDADRSGNLEAAEIESTSYVCDPLRRLTRVSAEPGDTSVQCPDVGGTRIEIGDDVDNDGLLSDPEVQETTFVCAGVDGERSIVATTPEPAGANCSDGGVRIDSGVDTSQDGVLQPNEVTGTTYACNGVRGADGAGGSAVRVSAEPAGANCPVGGTRIEVGPDLNGNGALDDPEVASTSFACDGNQNSTLLEVNDEPAGANCANGGRRIDTGIDDDQDGILDAVEIDSTSFVCDTGSTAVPFAILTQSLPDSFSTVAYDQELAAFGGTGGSYSWRISAGALPPGLSIDGTGTPSTDITGTPDTPGTYSFTVEVTDFFGSTATRSFTVVISLPPCGPNLGLQVGNTPTTIIVDSTFSSATTGVAADTSSTGFVYFVNDGSTIDRFDKVTGVTEDVDALIPGFSALDTNYIYIDGQDIYVTSDDTFCTNDCIWRVSSDAGMTWSLDVLGDFTTLAPNDDFNGMVVYDNTIFAITDDTIEAELYSMPASAGPTTLPTLLGTFADLDECQGLAADDDYLYTLCDETSSGTIEGLVRIDRITFTYEIQQISPLSVTSATGGQLYADDFDGDGLADVIYLNGDSNNDYYVCEPTGPLPLFFNQLNAGGDDEGMGFDPANRVIWQIDEGTTNAFSLD
ncbi:MAG: Ig domain-containing protein [Myxococcota bacterium]